MNQIVQKFGFSTTFYKPIIIIGAGTAGLNVASQLLRFKHVEPSQLAPGWTMVAGGIYDVNRTIRDNKDVFPKETNLIQKKVMRVDPENNMVLTEDGDKYHYDHLIVAAGIKLDYSQIKGLEDALEDSNSPVGTVYWYKYAAKFNQLAHDFKGGKAIFTEPQMPIKCAGAPQKIMYMSHDRWNKAKIDAQIEFNKTVGVVFGIPKYAQKLEAIIKEKGINLVLNSKLVEIRKNDRVAVFENQKTKELTEKNYDILHTVPPQVAPQFIAESGLADAQGYVNVNKETLQHVKYGNVWSLGDCSSAPTSKTAAAIMSETPVLIQNLVNVWKKRQPPTAVYDGYASCPIFTSQNQVLLAEFLYNGVVDETFPNFLQGHPNRLMFHLKRDFFPLAYWNFMSKGIWRGRDGFALF